MMSFSVKELRSKSLDELIALHDEKAKYTDVGVNYYLEEIARRDQERSNKVLINLTYALVFLTLVIAVLTIVLLLKG